jgi:hypothetical protein
VQSRKTFFTFLAALKDPDGAERTRALAALASYPDAAAGILPELHASLLSGLSGEAINAVGLLRRFPPDTPGLTVALGVALQNASSEVLVQALEVLEGLGARAGPVVEAVTRQLSHEEQRVRFAAIRTLQAIGPDARPALPALMAALRAEPIDFYVVPHVQCIHRLRPAAQDAIPLYFEVLRRRPLEAGTGTAALLGLTQFGTHELVEQVLRVRADDRRVALIIALKMLESMNLRDAMTALPEVEALLHDDEPIVRTQAAKALGYLVPDRDGLVVP